MFVRRHDRYMLKAFWSTFGAVVLFLTLISVVLDLSERLSRLSRFWDQLVAANYDPPWAIVEFYLTLIPFIWLQLLPYCVPVAAALCIARLLRHNEIAPLLTAGVSMRRVLAPIVVSSLLVTLLMVYAREDLVPDLGRRHMTLSRILSRAEPDRISLVPHFHDVDGGRLSMAAYMPIARKIERVEIQFFDDDGVLTALDTYPELSWDGARKRWVAENGGERIDLTGGGAPGTQRTRLEPGHVAPISVSISLLDITLMRSGGLGLSFSDSKELLDANPGNPRLTIMHHELFTSSASAVVLLLLALPFCVRVGSKRFRAMATAVMIIGLYFGTGYLSSSMGGAGDLNPVVLAWLPTVVFGSLGLALFWGIDG